MACDLRKDRSRALGLPQHVEELGWHALPRHRLTVDLASSASKVMGYGPAGTA